MNLALELADMVACLALGVNAAGVIAGAQFVEARGGSASGHPDDDQNGAGDGDQGPQLAAAPGDPPVTLAEEGGCPGCRRTAFKGGYG